MQAWENCDARLLKCRLHFGQRRFHRQGYLQRICAVLAGRRQQHARLALNHRVARLRFGALDHARHVLQPNTEAVVVRDHDLPEYIRRERLTFGLDCDALVARLNEPGPRHPRRDARSSQHVRKGKVVGQQACGQHLDLQLSHLAAEHDAPRHARHGQQARLEGPIREGPQFHRREAGRHQADFQQIHRGRRERRHARRLGAGRQRPRQLGQLFAECLARPENIDAFLEHHRHDGKSLDRLRTE